VQFYFYQTEHKMPGGNAVVTPVTPQPDDKDKPGKKKRKTKKVQESKTPTPNKRVTPKAADRTMDGMKPCLKDFQGQYGMKYPDGSPITCKYGSVCKLIHHAAMRTKGLNAQAVAKLLVTAAGMGKYPLKPELLADLRAKAEADTAFAR
jgi:hypothetical protein